jgi:hypothetical protein
MIFFSRTFFLLLWNRTKGTTGENGDYVKMDVMVRLVYSFPPFFRGWSILHRIFWWRDALRKGMRWDRIWIIPPMLRAHLGPRPERKKASIRSSKPNQLSIECIKEKERKIKGRGLTILFGVYYRQTQKRVSRREVPRRAQTIVCLGLFWTITRTYKTFWPVCFSPRTQRWERCA